MIIAVSRALDRITSQKLFGHSIITKFFHNTKYTGS